MLYKGVLVNQLSGSVAGVTASHNRGGTYLRQRSIPTNPGTSPQAVARGIMSSLVNAWSGELTAAQRTAWSTWALNVPFTNRVGDQVNIGGLGAYVGANVPRLVADAVTGSTLGRVDDGPTVFNRGEGQPATLNAAAQPDDLSIAFNNADGWANEDGGAILVASAAPQAATVNFFKGPYRVCAVIEGDGMTPPTSPAAVECVTDNDFSAGQRVFIYTRQLRADGRWSDRVYDSGISDA